MVGWGCFRYFSVPISASRELLTRRCRNKYFGKTKEEGEEKKEEKGRERRREGSGRVVNCWIFKALRNDPIQLLFLANEKLSPLKEEKSWPSRVAKS